MHARSPTASSRRTLLLAAACSAGLAACGGGGGGDPSGSPVVGVLGDVAAELQGDRTGVLSGKFARLAPGVLEISGTVLIQGNIFDFRTPVDANDQFSTRVDRPRVAEGPTAAPASSLVLAGKVEVFSLLQSPYTVTGTYQWQVPATPASSASAVAAATTFSGTIQPPRLPNNDSNDSDDSSSTSGPPALRISPTPGAQ